MRKWCLPLIWAGALMFQSACSSKSSSSEVKQVVMPTSLTEIISLYQNALSTGSTAQIDSLVASVTSLYTVPLVDLRRDIGLTPGFGEEYIPYAPLNSIGVAGVPQMAIELTNQGLAMLHNFHYIDSVRSLEQAVRIAPDYADAKIFLSMAYILFSGDIAGHLHSAKELAELAAMPLNQMQEAWYKFAEAYVFFSNAPGQMQGAYANLLNVTGSDDEALALGGWLSNFGRAADYQTVLNNNPNHVGANHYLVHLNEFASNFSGAVPFAQKLTQVSPKGAHAQHMYGHVLPMVGELETAISQLEISDRLHKDWAAANNFDPNYDWHFSHNSHLLGIAYLANGQITESYSALQDGCTSDFRSCDGLAKAAVGQQDAAKLALAKQMAIAQDPAATLQIGAYFDRYEAEMRYVSGVDTDAALIQQLAIQYQDNVLQVIALLKGLTPSSPLFGQITQLVDSFFAGGGFDSWTSGFPNVMRVRIAAEKFGHTDLVDYIDAKIESILNP